MRPHFHLIVFFTGFLCLLAAAAPVTVSVDTQSPGAEIPVDALGVSCETSRLLPDTNGVHYFSPANQPLVAVFQTLGIKSLRVGGNSVDAEKIPIPSEADVCSLFDFARAAGVKVIYGVRLKDGDAPSAAQVAKLVHARYADVLDSFAIGNEPYYYKDYAVYTNKWMAIRDAMLKEFPAAKFCGPDQNPNPELVKNVARDFGGAGHLVQITGHYYPFGCAYKNYKQVDITKLDPVDATTNKAGGPVMEPFDPAASREKMLSPAAYAGYEKVLKGLTNATARASLSFRLTEANSFWFSGLKGASDSYASALWSLDFLHWWAAHGAAGVNFHTGDRTGGTVSMPCRYAAFVTAADGYEIRPLGYGMKLFALGSRGKILPVRISSTMETNLTAYAVLDDAKNVFVTVINKAHGGVTNAEVQIKLSTPLAGTNAKVIFLAAKNHDLARGSADVTLGGAPVTADGHWLGYWTALPVSESNSIAVTLPPASAAVIRIQTR
jgi:hypothetical protein